MVRLPEHAERDFTGGCLVVEDGRLLLVNHSKLGMWLQPGGHVEPDETPDETARRETIEETGIHPEFHPGLQTDDSSDASHNLPRPFRVNYHRIRDGHWHCSFLYLATVAVEAEATHAEEHDGMTWFSWEELRDETVEIPENIRDAGITAIEEVDA